MNSRTDVAVGASPPTYGVQLSHDIYGPVVTDGDGVVAVVLPQRWRTATEADAIARLFAAAPQLLAVCQQARRWVETSPVDNATATPMLALLVALDHVLAAATGGDES